MRPSGTPFQLAVWEALRRIPYGATVTYGELARGIGRPTAARAVGADHAVTRHDDGQRVAVVCAADGPCGGGPADAACQFAVRDGRAVGDAPQRLPDGCL